MEELSALSELQLIQGNDEVKVTYTFSLLLVDNLRRELWIVPIEIEAAERRARRRSHNPCGLKGTDELEGLLAIRLFVKVPWLSVPLARP